MRLSTTVRRVYEDGDQQADDGAPHQRGSDQAGPPGDDPRAGIREAVGALDELDQLPLHEHVERFEAVHTELTVALTDIDKI